MQTKHPMPNNFYRHFETDCVKLCGEIKHRCACNGSGIQTVTPFDNEKPRIEAKLGFARKA